MFPLGFITYLVIIAAGSITGLIGYQKKAGLKPVAILLLITLISEITSRFLAFYFKNSNPAYHFLNPLQTILWCLFFRYYVRYVFKKNLITLVSVLLLIYSAFDSIFITGLLKFPSLFLSIQTIALIVFGFLLFFEKLDEPAEKNIFRDEVFIICLAVIWFYLISFLFFNFHKFSLSKKVNRSTLKIINYVSNYIYYLLLLYALILNSFYKNPQDKKNVT